MSDSPPELPRDRAEMPFLDHLEELRWALLRGFVALLVGATVATFFIGDLVESLQWPLRFALGDRFATEVGEGLITTSPLGVFAVFFQVTLIGGGALGGPLLLYSIGRFVAPGLTVSERRVILPGVIAAFFLFVLGALFAFFVLAPTALTASVTLNEWFGFRVLWTADRYYGFLGFLIVGLGMACEFPLVLLLLVWIGILDVAKLRAGRRYTFLGVLVVSAVITPTTDPVTFLVLALPLYLLYELSILAARPIERARLRRLEPQEDAEPPSAS